VPTKVNYSGQYVAPGIEVAGSATIEKPEEFGTWAAKRVTQLSKTGLSQTQIGNLRLAADAKSLRSAGPNGLAGWSAGCPAAAVLESSLKNTSALSSRK
jgi:hypothetical protein